MNIADTYPADRDATLSWMVHHALQALLARGIAGNNAMNVALSMARCQLATAHQQAHADAAEARARHLEAGLPEHVAEATARATGQLAIRAAGLRIGYAIAELERGVIASPSFH